MLGSLNICSIPGGFAKSFPLQGPGLVRFNSALEPFDLSKEADMKLHVKFVAALAVLALGLVPAIAGAVSYEPEYHPAHPPHPTTAPKGHAYGYWCKGESKKHVKGEKGTAFSRCVRAHKRAANQPDLTPRQACKDLNKKHDRSGKHVAHGEKGTAFSRCVKSVAQQRKEENATVTASTVA
jgi:hypothetical protein